MDTFMSIKKTADELGISDKTIRKWVKNGTCPGFYVGAKFLVNVDMLDEMLKDMSKQKARA